MVNEFVNYANRILISEFAPSAAKVLHTLGQQLKMNKKRVEIISSRERERRDIWIHLHFHSLLVGQAAEQIGRGKRT